MPLHPTVKKIIDVAYKKDFDNLHEKSIEEVRQTFEKGRPTESQIDPNLLTVISLPGGASIRLHSPKNCQSDGLLFYIKACGYTFGRPSDSDMACYRLAKHLKCKVASIEHRLAPEFKFPIPFEDCVRAVEYMIEHHATYDINQNKIVTWGESSGANISCGLGHHFRNKGQQLIRKQILFYPPLDYTQSYPSNEKYGMGFLTEIAISDYFIRHYVPQEKDLANPFVSPLLHKNLAGLPELVLFSAQYDLFKDEHDAYIQKVVDAGGNIEAYFAIGLVHGYLWHQNHIKEVMHFNQLAAEHIQKIIRT